MISNNDIVKLIFGFKIKHLRLEHKKSYQEVSDETGLSISYLNDIEKGKKYPKPDKIQALAGAFNLSYDELVSTNSDKKLKPIIELFNSGFFKYFPLNEFGISIEKLVDVFSSSPIKFSAFISTILKMVRSYQIEKEHFYRVALRSYQDIHDNYFPELEEAAKHYRKEKKLRKIPFDSHSLEDILKTDYDVTTDRVSLPKNKKLAHFRSYYKESEKIIFLNHGLSEAQEIFLLAKEIGFQYLKLQDRPAATQLSKEASFENLLNNFKASYFAAALMMDETEMVKDIQQIALSANWNNSLITSIINKYRVTPEMLLQRLTNILPHHFGISDLFFIRLLGTKDMVKYEMTKELHLSQLHNPYQTELDEHLCHRWVSVRTIKNIRSSKKEYIIDSQISEYWQTQNAYFCISIAQPSSFNLANAGSVTLGLMMTDKLKASFNFIKDPKLKVKTVHTTCERCSIHDCDNRVAPPDIIDAIELEKELENELNSL
jgi:transcriptional regulator with XRE-family HTH domain/Zn-dependent peptidase ImmA (M78 family)